MYMHTIGFSLSSTRPSLQSSLSGGFDWCVLSRPQHAGRTCAVTDRDLQSIQAIGTPRFLFHECVRQLGFLPQLPFLSARSRRAGAGAGCGYVVALRSAV